MRERFENNWNKVRKWILYIGLLLVVKLFLHDHHFTTGIYIIFSSMFIIPELISEYRPECLAYLVVNRKMLAISILLVFNAAAAYCYLQYPLPPGTYGSTFEAMRYSGSSLLQGATIGLVTRMLVVHTFHQLIRARDAFIAKVLILAVYAAFLLLLPLRHKHFIPFYLSGFSLGFFAHYLARVTERKSAIYSRLRQNLLSMVESIKRGGTYTLSTEEEAAINLYARQQWGKLQHLLNRLLNKTARPIQDTEVLFFIRLSMLRKLHRYGEAINAINEKKMENPVWYKKNEHFFYLHRALNLNENQGSKENPKRRHEVLNDIIQAVRINEQCLLSNATLALMLANDIDDDHPKECDDNKKSGSLKFIWRAMNIYEENEHSPKIISLVTGFYIPFTYSFLLDSYGYVLLKNGKLRFAKALFIQCLEQDPSFSASYLHLAEWYIAYFKTHRNDHWKKAARLNLYIALYNEKLDNKGGSESYISNKARRILSEL